MKRLLLIVLPLLLIVGCSKPINEEILIDKDGLKYHPDTKELYSGKVLKNHMGGKTEFEGSYKDGKRDGLWKKWSENELSNLKYFTYYRNGKKEQEQLYKDEKLSFTTGWYENGKKKSQGIPKDGKVDGDGLWTFWYENGQKKYEGTYKDGKLVEVIGEWNEDGSVKE